MLPLIDVGFWLFQQIHQYCFYAHTNDYFNLFQVFLLSLGWCLVFCLTGLMYTRQVTRATHRVCPRVELILKIIIILLIIFLGFIKSKPC